MVFGIQPLCSNQNGDPDKRKGAENAERHRAKVAQNHQNVGSVAKPKLCVSAAFFAFISGFYGMDTAFGLMSYFN